MAAVPRITMFDNTCPFPSLSVTVYRGQTKQAHRICIRLSIPEADTIQVGIIIIDYLVTIEYTIIDMN